MKYLPILLLGFLFFTGCDDSKEIQNNVQVFLDDYNKEYQELYYEASKAEWELNTHIVEGDSTNAVRYTQASEAIASFTGSKENIDKIQTFLKEKNKLTPLQVKQLEAMLYKAANNPQTIPDVIKARIAAEAAQTETLYGYKFKTNGQTLSANDIDEALVNNTDLNKRLEVWTASKELGKELKPGMINLQQLRNKAVQALDYSDYFTYQVSAYGMDAKEMLELNRQIIGEIWPLYRELHTFARYELAKKYGVNEVPDYLPAHWLPNRWGQDWSSIVDVEGLDLDGILKEKSAEWIMKQGESFYLSLGFDSLPPVFWEKSSLYPAPPNAGYMKNTHASAWHMDLENDLRSLMSVTPTAEWYETVHHELGHIYYFQSYTNPDVPVTLREGANRAFHEAIGSQMGLAAMQKPFLAHLNLLPADSQTDDMSKLLKDALNYIVFMPWSSGVMTEFEHDFYVNNLSPDQYNKRWWELVKKYQGIIPPSDRGEEYMDAATKTHINDDAAQYYDYALSFVLMFQFHNYIAENILKQDPHATNYFDNKEVGEFLKSILKSGGTVDSQKLLKDTIGEEMSAKAMLKYFEPLMNELKKINEGRQYTLPESI
ncbi:MAG: M2 family metallopeptidase [Ignavibacteriaceae bacterium]